jgi:hypothetical protein
LIGRFQIVLSCALADIICTGSSVNRLRNQYALTPNIDETVRGIRENIASYTLKIMNQFSFILNTDIRPTQTHYNRLACLVTELYATLNRPQNTIEELLRGLEDWSYKFDRYWFLFAIYVDNPTPLIECLPDHNLNGLPTTLAQPIHGYTATHNSTLLHQYNRHRGTDIIIDGHGLLVDREDPSLLNSSPEGSNLSLRLRNAAALSSSLMNAVAILPVDHQTPTPLVFETTRLEKWSTLRTSLWEGRDLVVPADNAVFAHRLAEAVHGLHVCNVQHGSIMPDCVLVASVTQPLLHGFLCNPSGYWGWNTSDGPLSFNGYYQMARREEKTMKNDIRNLGICLLELGSTNSFLKQQNKTRQRGKLWTVGRFLNPSDLSMQSLLELVDNELDDLGHRFSAVVRACLTVSDLRLGQRTYDEKVDLSIWFIDNVLLELRKVDVDFEEIPLEQDSEQDSE